MKTPAQWPRFSSLEAAGFQCITVTANTTMMAALREPMTANGRSSLRYSIATPSFRVRLQRRSAPFWFDNRKKKSCCICQGGILGSFSPDVVVDQPAYEKKEPVLGSQVAAQRPQSRPGTPFDRHAVR
jgi:hypothetical protein